MEDYTTIEGRAEAEIEQKKSRFICALAHVETEEQAQEFVQSVREKHKAARHNVYAWILRDGNRERCSDDGEPQKTAGLPTLETLRGAGVTDIVAVTTRYFGGTLLGTGGLVRAYTQAAQAALANANIVLVSSCVDITIRIPYPLYDKIAYQVGQENTRVLDTSFTSEVQMTIRMLEGTQERLLETIRQTLAGKGSIQVSDPLHTIF
ncbi:MAG: YigZ family protein [Eggerthellales bacterium]|nr:YigZ family protein [Eggerthellales bacterium]